MTLSEGLLLLLCNLIGLILGLLLGGYIKFWIYKYKIRHKQ